MKKTIICFGDSNTHGYCSETGGRFDDTQRYPCLLEKYLGNGYIVREEGLSGRTTVFEDPLFEGLSGLSAIFGCLMSHEPVDLLIIMLGTNDTKERFGCNAENIAKGLERLTKKRSLLPMHGGIISPIFFLLPLPLLRKVMHQLLWSMKWGMAVWKNPASWPFITRELLT